jgi:hypothetical protein
MSVEANPLLLRLAAAERLSAFYHWLDQSDYGRCLDCFTDDAIWFRLGKPYEGRAEISAVLEARPALLMVRHLLSNLFTTLGEDGDAVTHAYVSVHTHRFEDELRLPAPIRQPIGIYAITAQMRRTDGEAAGDWRIAHLAMQAQFYTPLAPQPQHAAAQ